MKLIWWMLAGSLLTALAATFIITPETKMELWTGMLGPLVSALISWIAMQRQYRKRPERLTALMIKAFVIKMIFFAAYITVLVRFGSVKPIPFVASFGAYFIALHITEAFGLRRLQITVDSIPTSETQGQF